MAQFSIQKAKTKLSKLIDIALDGGEVIITRDSVAAVRLVPVVPSGQRCFGALKDKIAVNARFEEPLPKDELAGWNLA